MKKTLSFLLTLCMLCTACAFAAADGTVTVRFWHSASEEAGEKVAEYADTFNRTIGAEKGIRVEPVYQGSYSESVQKMNQMIMAGNTDQLPDVMQLDATGKVAYAACDIAFTADAIAAENTALDLGNYLAPALSNWNYCGTQLGLPFATSTTVTYYNKTLFDQAGALPPVSLQDIGALQGVLPAQAADGQPLTIFACVPNTPTLANWLGQTGAYLVNERNGNDGSATTLACVQDGSLSAFLAAWKALYASGALKNGSASSDAFAAGQLALMTSSSSSIASLKARIGGSFELGVCAYPRVTADAMDGATVSGSCLVLFDHGDAQRAAAEEWMLYLTGEDVQADFAMHTGYIPSHVLAAQTDTWAAFVQESPEYQVALDQLNGTPASMCSVTVGPSADFYYTIMNDISDMLDQDLSVEETLAQMEEDLNGLLYQYARSNVQ